MYDRKFKCYQFRMNTVDLQEPENQGVIPSHLAVCDTGSIRQTASKKVTSIRCRVMSTTT